MKLSIYYSIVQSYFCQATPSELDSSLKSIIFGADEESLPELPWLEMKLMIGSIDLQHYHGVKTICAPKRLLFKNIT